METDDYSQLPVALAQQGTRLQNHEWGGVDRPPVIARRCSQRTVSSRLSPQVSPRDDDLRFSQRWENPPALDLYGRVGGIVQ